MESFYGISSLVTGVLSFLLGLAVYLRNKKQKTNILWFLLTSSIGLWSFGTYQMTLSSTHAQALFWSRFLHVAAISIPVFFVHFAVALTGRKSKVVFLAYCSGLILTLAIIFNLVVGDAAPKLSFRYFPVAGSFYWLYLLNFLGWAAFAIWTLADELPKASGHKRDQIKYVLAGMAVGFIGGSTNYLLVLGIGVYPVGHFFVLFYAIAVSYAIIKHRLMDIKALVLKSVAYTIIISLIALTYVFIVFYIKRYWEGIINPDIAFIAAGFLIAFGFQPLRRFIQKYTDKVFAKGGYNFREVVGNLSNILSHSLTEQDIARPVITTLASELRLSQANFAITSSPEVAQLETTANSCLLEKDKWDRISKLIDSPQIIVTDELSDQSEMKEILREQSIEVLVPLYKQKDDLGGYLALGEKKSGDAYTQEDIKLLEMVAPQISTALRTAKKHKGLIKQVIKERERIQQDAHDKIYNRLGALANSCELALGEPELAEETLRQVDDCLRRTVVDLQQIVEGKELEDEGPCEKLLEKLKRICKDHERDYSQTVDFICFDSVVGQLNHKDFWHIQCIIQECLNNIRKYAGARHVSVVLKTDPPDSQEEIVLTVSDDGWGFKKPIDFDSLPEDCQGLRGMKKRAEQLGGNLWLESGIDGTEIGVRIPVKEEA